MSPYLRGYIKFICFHHQFFRLDYILCILNWEITQLQHSKIEINSTVITNTLQWLTKATHYCHFEVLHDSWCHGNVATEGRQSALEQADGHLKAGGMVNSLLFLFSITSEWKQAFLD